MNKYEIAAKLDAAGARAWFIQRAFEGRDLGELLVHAESSRESAEEAAEFRRKDVAAIRAVMREIEAEKQPAEPEASIDSDAPCVKCGLPRDGVSECGCKMHDGPQPCHPGHTPNIMRHPYQAPEKSYDGPRYASGEQPMIGDKVQSNVNGELYRILDFHGDKVLPGHSAAFFLPAVSPHILSLVRRAEAAK